MVVFAYLKLIRTPVLLMIAGLQYGIRFFVIEPMIEISGYELAMSNIEFGYLVLSTLLITAGGFTINDYFDAKIDRINKPKKVVVDRIIKRRVAMALHVLLSSLGIALAAYLCYNLGMWRMTSVFLFAVFVLWFYSTNLKHQFLIGNVTMAILAGSVTLIVGLFEIPLLNGMYPESVENYGFSIFNVPAYWIIGYSLLIGLFALTREITKDIIDIRGDKLHGCNTLPISLGVANTKSIIIALYLAILAGLTWTYLKFIDVHSWQLGVIFFLILISTAIQPVLIYRARIKNDFYNSSRINSLSITLILISMYFLRLSILSYFADGAY
jgi:4-hydroxybenzoate polyprenyltransferase